MPVSGASLEQIGRAWRIEISSSPLFARQPLAAGSGDRVSCRRRVFD